MMNGAKCCCLIQVLKEAARNIGEDYFRTEFAESQSGYKYRERIYTYELYHQLRLVIENLGWRLVLHGEMDKRAHTNPDIKNKIPDMILHIPGTHENNLLVLEVKTYENAVRNRRTVKIDFLKLLTFTRDLYPYGVFWVFGGEDENRLKCAVQEAFMEAQCNLVQTENDRTLHPEKLWIMWHQAVGEVPIAWRIKEFLRD